MSTLLAGYQHVTLPKQREDMLLLDYAPRSRIHFVPSIHTTTMLAAAVMVIWLFTIVVGFFDISESFFFRFGDPYVGNTQLTNDTAFWLLLGMLAVDGAAARVAGEVFAQWKEKFIQDPRYRSLGAALALGWMDILLHWLRNTITVIFLYSQISFAVAMALGDMLAHVVLSQWAISAYRGFISDWDSHRATQHPDSQEDVNTINKLAEKHSKGTQWSFSAFVVMCVLQVGAFGLLNAALWYVGFFETDYFTLGPPTRIFSYEMNHDDEYWITVVYIFFDQVLASAVGATVYPWLQGMVFNNAAYKREQYSLPDWKTYLFYYVYRISAWARGLIVLNFTFAQAVFTVAFALGELVYGTYHIVAQYLKINEPTHQLDIAIALHAVQLLGYVIYGLALPIYDFPGNDKIDAPETARIGYFIFPPPFAILGQVFTSQILLAWFTFFGVVFRMVVVVKSETVDAYIGNVIRGLDPLGVRYHPVSLYSIVLGGNLFTWFNLVIATQFAIANFFMSFFALLGELLISGIVIGRYLAYKHKADGIVRSFSHYDAIQSREMQQRVSKNQ